MPGYQMAKLTMKRKPALLKKSSSPAKAGAKGLLADVREMILVTRQTVAQTVNSTLTSLYWEIGTRIRQDMLKSNRAGYGEQLVVALARQLEREFGRGFNEKELWRTLQLADVELQRLRTEDRLSPDLVFRDPYFLGFLGLKNSYSEKDLEAAILREMESSILELGVGFASLGRQKRITVDGVDHYLDLLFYHRRLRRLVAIDLKLREFKPGDKGQMELYLKWLDRYERKEGEEKPIGLILCAGKLQETVELLDLEQSGIRVSAYWTKALPKKELERKLHDAVRLARARLQAINGTSGAMDE
jgi:predicted nuclease of restriction endonuclease-like (RecB) superfamily